MTANRQAPTPITHPGGLTGAQYVTDVAEEIDALWASAFAFATYASGGASTPSYTCNPPFTSMSRNNGIIFVPNDTSTGSVTMDVDSLGGVELLTNDGSSIVAGQLAAGSVYMAVHDGTNWRLTHDIPDIGALTDAYPLKNDPVPTDKVTIADSEDSNASKKINISQIAGLNTSDFEFILSSGEFSGETSFDMTSLNTSYQHFVLIFNNLKPSLTGNLTLRGSTDGGSTWISSLSYRTGVSLGTSWELGTQVQASTSFGASGVVWISNHGSGPGYPFIQGQVVVGNASSQAIIQNPGGWLQGSTPLNALQLRWSGVPVFSSGNATLYGIRGE